MNYTKAPEAPDWLKKVPRAHEKWNKIWLALEQTRIKPDAHEDFVVQYCIAYSDMREAMERMERSKLVKETRTVGVGDKAKTTIEKLTVSPFQTIYDNATRNMDRLGRFLGLDPVSPLDEVRTFQDYADFLRIEDDGGDYVDDGGDGGTCVDATGETEIHTGSTGENQVLDR